MPVGGSSINDVMTSRRVHGFCDVLVRVKASILKINVTYDDI